MPSAWHSRAGPRARSRSPAGPLVSGPSARPAYRRRAASAAPSITRPARSSTADAVPSGRQTRFTQKCMP